MECDRSLGAEADNRAIGKDELGPRLRTGAEGGIPVENLPLRGAAANAVRPEHVYVIDDDGHGSALERARGELRAHHGEDRREEWQGESHGQCGKATIEKATRAPGARESSGPLPLRLYDFHSRTA